MITRTRSRREALRLLAATGVVAGAAAGLGAGKAGARPVAAASPHASPSAEPRIYGVLEPDKPPVDTLDLAGEYQDGLRVREVGVGWSSYETAQNTFNNTYLAGVKQRINAYRAAGYGIQLDLGMQYPPAWVFRLPGSHFVNQFGDAYSSSAPGGAGVNAVFSQSMRQAQEQYVSHLFGQLGNDFAGIRLGWGRSGEIGYPHPTFGTSKNSYWAFDDIAQGKVPGRPPGVAACPVPGWIPGTPDSSDARLFIDWYLDSLRAYQQWQISTVRTHFAGPLVLLYGSRGVRPGQLSAAIDAHLDGTTAAETDSDLQRGMDYARLIGSISDKNVAPCTTWIDCVFENPDDTSSNPALWSPVHYFAALAEPLGLQTWSENTGHASYDGMLLSFQRMQAYNVHALMWAFHSELYNTAYATMAQYAQLIAQYP